MLSKLDDYPIHQTPEPLVRPATSDSNAYDRYWFGAVHRDGDFILEAAFGRYPNLGVMDASVSIVRDGTQRSFHASRLAPREPTETAVGPLTLEVVEELRSIRIRIEPNDTGIECALVFRSRTPALEEDRTTMRQGERIQVDMTRFTQFGTWEGTISADGTETAVDPGEVYGTRDRSWGIRPVGQQAPGKPGDAPGICWLWAPIHFEDECRLFGYFQRPGGEIWGSGGMRVPVASSPDLIADPESPGFDRLTPTGQRLTFRPGSRWISSGEFDVVPAGGDPYVMTVETLLRFDMCGLGYSNPEWGHGHWKGDEVVGAESWVIDDVAPSDPYHQHVHSLVRARIGDREGVGIVEQIIYGPHTQLGFSDFLDGAP